MSCSVKLEFKSKEQFQAICSNNVGLQARLLSRTPGFWSIILLEKWVSSSALSYLLSQERITVTQLCCSDKQTQSISHHKFVASVQGIQTVP